MCRLVAYLGTPILVDEIITKPENSLIHQSYDAQESVETVNGDGFGLGWYDKSIREEPALFKSTQPAWNDENLLYNASFIKTSCFLSHVRAASVGGVSLENTHPFHYKESLMMHNGSIFEFEKIKMDLVGLLDEESFNWIKGQSDTQYFIALFMTNLRRKKTNEKKATADQLIACFKETFNDIDKLKKAKNIKEPSLFNVVMTDGNRMVATRYSTNPEEETRTLHYIEKIGAYTKKGVLHTIENDKGRTATLLSSEKLNDSSDWKTVPQNHAVFIDENLDVTLYDLDK